MTRRIGIFVGSLTNANVRRLVRNHGEMLGSEFELDLISTAGEVYDTDQYDNVIGVDFSQSVHGALSAAREYVERYDPDVLLQTNRPHIHGTIVGLLGKQFDVTSIYRYAGDNFKLYTVANGWKTLPYFLLNNVLGRAPLHLADKFIVLGPNGRDRLLARGVSDANIEFIPPTIDVDRFVDQKPVSLPIPDERTIVLYLGRRSFLKGVQTMERIIPEVLRRREDIHFVFVGKGRKISVDSGWEDHVTVVGEVDPAKVPGYLTAADLLVHPSLIEGVPRALLEAIATDTPVIARDVGEVSTVTENTFYSDNELVNSLCDFESLESGTIDSFRPETVSHSYERFLRRL